MEENTEDLTIFDTWTEADEEAAVEQVKTSYKIRHVIKNGEFWALAPHGTIYKLPLSLSIADFEKLTDAENDTDQFEVIKSILAAFVGDELAAKLEHEPVLFAFNLLQDYGETLAKVQGTSLGKSDGSVDSSTETTEPESEPISQPEATVSSQI